MNQPWGLSGPQFLAVFGAGLAVTAFAPLLLRLLLGWMPGGRLTSNLDAYEVGYLAGGPDRAADVVITELVTSGALRVDSSGQVTTADLAVLNARSGPLASGATAGSSGSLGSVLVDLPELRLALAPKVYKLRKRLARTQAVAAIGTRLRAERLIISKPQVNLIRVVSLTLWAALLVTGILRLYEGAENHRPTGDLSALFTVSLFIFVFSLFVLVGKLRNARTSLGSQVLMQARADQGDGAGFAASAVGGPGLAGVTGVALFGVALTGFAAVQDESLRNALLAGMPTASSGGGDGGVSGGSGCGGGGCGGGGCGG